MKLKLWISGWSILVALCIVLGLYTRTTYSNFSVDKQKILNSPYAITQHKIGMLQCLQYLIHNGYISEDNDMLQNANRLADIMTDVRYTICKYYYSNEKSALEKVRETFFQAEKLEKSVLERARALIAQALSESLL